MAGLFGLVLAAYAIIDPKLKLEGDSDEEVKESLDILRKRYYNNIMMPGSKGDLFSTLKI